MAYATYNNLGKTGSETPVLNRIIEINTAEQKHNILTNNEIVVIDYHATWCAPCKAIAPLYQALANRHEDILFGKEDVDNQITDNIRGVPAFHVFKNNELVYTAVGGAKLGDVENKINVLRNTS